MSQEEAVENEGGVGEQAEEDPLCPTSCGQPVKPCPKRKKRKVSYLWRPPPPSPRPSYSPCPHIYFKNLKTERQKELSRDEHMGILSTPSKHPWQKSTLPRPQLIRYKKRDVTARNIQLAVPKLNRVQALFEEQRDCGVLEISRLERLEAMLQEEFLLSPVQAKKIVKSVKRRKKKKLEVCEPCPFMDERIPSTEFSRENFMKGMISEIANHVSDVTEIKQGPTAKRLGEIVTAIMERIEGLIDEDTPPPDPAQNFADGKLSQLLVNCAGRMAGWIENVVFEADKAVIENFEAADAENRPPPCDHDILPCGHLPMLPCGHQVIVPCSFHTTACYPPPPREPKPPPPSPPCDPCCQMPPPATPCKEWVPCYENAPKCGKRKPPKCGKKKHKKKKRKQSKDDDEDEETCRCTCECEPPRKRGQKKGKKKKGKGKDKKGKKGEDDEETLVGQHKDDEEGDGDAGETGGEETEGEGGESEVEGGGEGGDDGAGGAGGGDEGEGGETEEPTTGSKPPSSKTSPGKTPPKTPTSGGSKPTSPSKTPEKSPPPKSPSGKSPPKSADKTPGDKSPAKSGDKSPAKSGDKSPSKSGDKTPGKSGDKSPVKSGDKSPSKSGDKSPGKSGDKSPVKSGDKSPSKSGAKSPGKTGSKPPSESATPGKKPGEDGEGGEGDEGGEGEEGEAGTEGAPGDETENAVDAQDQQIEDLGDALAEEAIGDALEEETEETTTFNSILEQLAVLVDDIPDKDPDKRRLQLTKKLEDKFTELVTLEGEMDEATKQTVIKVAKKIANWMEDVIEEAESRLSSLADGDMTVSVLPPCQRVPSPVTSESVRDWASWIVEAMAVADDWADWISKTVRAAEEKAAKKKGMVVKEDGGVDKLTRKEYTAWKDDVKSGAIDYRMKKKQIAEMAYDWKQKTHDRPMTHRPKPGDPTTSAAADEEPAPPPAEEEAPPPEEEAPPEE